MIVFALRCSAGHEFEAWFRNSAAFVAQRGQGQISCPDCGDATVEKAVMAPRLGGQAKAPEAAPTKAPLPAANAGPPGSPAELRRMLQQLRRAVETHCEHVGDRFAEEARRIHNGEAEIRGIYGKATEEESKALVEDGIEIAAIPWVPLSDA